jgi:AraC-like DNA-binding protein
MSVLLCDIVGMKKFDPFPVINGASGHELVRGGTYRWNSLRRGGNPEVILQRTLTGEGRVRVGEAEHAVGVGRVLIVVVPEDAEYWFDPEVAGEWSFQWLNMGGEWVRDLWLNLRGRFGEVPAMDARGAAARQFSLLVADFAANRLQERRSQAEACHALFLQFWLELEGGDAPPPEGHTALRELILRRHREPVNIKELCAEVGQSREHLCRAFRRAWGIEPAAWMRNLRLDAAETYLRQSTSGLDEIARRVGFGSGRQLARAFQASRGLTPTAFRR